MNISTNIKTLISITETLSNNLNKPVDLAADTIKGVTDFTAKNIKDNKYKLSAASLAALLAAKPGLRHGVRKTAAGTYHFFRRGFGYDQ